MYSTIFTLLPLVPFIGLCAAAEDPSCAPGGNLDLSFWELELPTGPQGDPTTIPSSKLQGCQGYTDSYFLTESGDGATVMKAPSYPSSGCSKYSGSKHCRTEFHEVNPDTGDNNVSWSPGAAINRMYVSLMGNYGSSTCIGQVFQAPDGNPKDNKPLAEVYYGSNGDIRVGVEAAPTGNAQGTPTSVANVPQGTPFTYELRYENNALQIQVNDEGLKDLKTEFTPQGCFFKMGNYNQGDDAADIHLYNLTVQHS